MRCPRCEAKLTSGTYEEHDAFHCDECFGTLFQQTALGKTLERFSRDTYSQVPIETPVPPLDDNKAPIDCPVCELPMENYGYLGTKKVMLDACNQCELVWVDTLELATMAQMRARTDKNLLIMQDNLTPLPIVYISSYARIMEDYLAFGFTRRHRRRWYERWPWTRLLN